MSSKSKPALKGGMGLQRPQPLRATQPFQLRQGSPARKSPSSSPTSMLPRSATDPRRNKWSSDHRNSPDRSDRKSPSSPGIKVTNRRSPSPRVCRTSSHDSVPALTGTYLTGQWPREVTSSYVTTNNSGTTTKSTQTPHDWSLESLQQQSKTSKSLSNRSAVYQDAEVKQMKQQMRRIAKSRQEKKERHSPVHANHAAMPQPQPRSMPNPIPIYGRGPRRHSSLEGLNKEIENITIKDAADSPLVRYTANQGITPPDGHRAPLPRSSTRTTETQTPQGFSIDASHAVTDNNSPSPNAEGLLTANMAKVGEQGVSPGPKYASSPRPNNSYMFKREPPEGAESVKPFKEQDARPSVGSSCPDKEKINFQISKNGSFTKWKPSCGQDDSGTLMSCCVEKGRADGAASYERKSCAGATHNGNE